MYICTFWLLIKVFSPKPLKKLGTAELWLILAIINCIAFHRDKSILDILASNTIDELRPEDVSAYLGLKKFEISSDEYTFNFRTKWMEISKKGKPDF